MDFDPTRPYRLHPDVAVRPEPFGALAYHYGNRRLNFLRSHDLVTLVRDLDDHTSVDAAVATAPIADDQRSGFRRALERLAASDFIVPTDSAPTGTPT